MGALGPAAATLLDERFRDARDPTGMVPKFMYGSHYSSAGIVLHFLVRCEPFARLAVELQGGKFDVPDRLFFSLAHAWRSATRSMTDVKELVPELFYCPEMLLNHNSLPLGARQAAPGDDGDAAAPGSAVDDVELPAWAGGCADAFVRTHRDALESEAVSETLPGWIDLVFGDAQRGLKAATRGNVFYHLTYEGAIDVDGIDDDDEREATRDQIKHRADAAPAHGAAPAAQGRRDAAPFADCPREARADGPGAGASPDGRGLPFSANATRALALRRARAPAARGWPLLGDGAAGRSRATRTARAAPRRRRRAAGAARGGHAFGRATVVAADPRAPDAALRHGRRRRLRLRWVAEREALTGASRRRATATTRRRRATATSARAAAPAAPDRAAAGDALTSTAARCGRDGDDAGAPAPPALRCSHALFGHARAVAAVAYSATLDVAVSGDERGDAYAHAAVRRAPPALAGGRGRRRGALVCLALLDVEVAVAAAAETALAPWASTAGGARVAVDGRAGKESEIPNFKGSDLGRRRALRGVRGQRGLGPRARAAGGVDVRRAHDLALVHVLDVGDHGPSLGLAFSPDDRHLLVAAADGAVLVCSDPKSRLLQLDAALAATHIGLDTGLFAFNAFLTGFVQQLCKVT
ncbi:hypothetical protein JL720_16626 [Aureococcus anophagefferens]|nr:hypothetical protein JL720_16626 [Aureococcus anophagefferens]